MVADAAEVALYLMVPCVKGPHRLSLKYGLSPKKFSTFQNTTVISMQIFVL